MGKKHQLLDRRQHILETIEKAGQLSVAKLRTQFGVSEVAIRHDLQALSKQGFLLRTHGGALSVNTMPEFSFDVHQHQHAAQKSKIGRAAARLVSYGDTIFLDASTTVHPIIPYLKDYSKLTIITNILKCVELVRGNGPAHGASTSRKILGVSRRHRARMFAACTLRAGHYL